MSPRTTAARLTAELLEDRTAPAAITTPSTSIVHTGPVTANRPRLTTTTAIGQTAIYREGYAVGAVVDDHPRPGDRSAYVDIYDPAGTHLTGFIAYSSSVLNPNFTQIYVARADVTGDGVADVITGTDKADTAASAERVQVFDGATLSQAAPTVVRDFHPFGLVTAGSFVAAGDFDGDRKADVVVARYGGGTGRVKVYSGADLANPRVVAVTPVVDFDGISDPNATGGAMVAVGDVNADRVPDVAVGAVDGPRVAVFNGTTLRVGQTPTRLFNDFFAFDLASYSGGVNVAVGDLIVDGYAEIIATTRADRRDLAVYDGKTLVQTVVANPAPWLSGTNFGAAFRYSLDSGLRVTVKRLDTDARADLLLSHPYGSRVTIINGKDITPGTNIDGSTLPNTFFDSLDPPNEWVGVWVG